MKSPYLKRIADDILKEKLSLSGAVLIEGPKWCGKTRTAEESSKSQLYMQDPDNFYNYQQIMGIKPSTLLDGETPRLIDEWQTAPALWDAIRFVVDQRGKNNQFILTGSSVPRENEFKHSGIGRIARMSMRTMTLYESGESNGTISLKSLFDQKAEVSAKSDTSIEDIAFALTRGGWPIAVTEKNKTKALKYATLYTEAIAKSDISRVDNVNRDPKKANLLLKSLARNISTIASKQTIFNDISAEETNESFSEKTFSQYLNALNRIYFTENVPAWNPALRSKATIRSSDKIQLTDPSIATAIMRLSPESLFNDLRYFGFLFESLCDRDMRVYAEAIDGNLYHYRDSEGLEADEVIVLNDGRWGAIEIKLSETNVEEAASHLLSLKEKIDTNRLNAPSFLMVITATKFAYQRPDGVLVVPLCCLKP